MKKQIWLAIALLLSGPSLISQGNPTDNQLPPNPEPGKCYVKCITPDVWKNETVTVLKTPAYTKLEIIPAKYETVTETYVATPSYTKYNVIPAKFESEKVYYTSKEGRTDLSIVAPKFTPASETIETKSAFAQWEYTVNPDCQSPNPGDCKYVCYKEYPAESKTVSTKTVQNAYTTDVPVDEKKSYYTKKNLIPARVEESTVPEVTKTYTWQKLVSAASTKTINVDAVYEDVMTTVLVQKGGVTVWDEVECGLVSGQILPIYYNLGSAALTGEAKTTINNTLYKYMKDNPNQLIEISSHTDSRGDDASNLDLSERRAQSVVNYLVNKGINPSRLISTGYGETRLQNHCSNGANCTEAQHRKNRRTEFRVVSE